MGAAKLGGKPTVRSSYSHVKRSTGHTHTHTTAEQTTHLNTERAMAQRRLIVEVVVEYMNIFIYLYVCVNPMGAAQAGREADGALHITYIYVYI